MEETVDRNCVVVRVTPRSSMNLVPYLSASPLSTFLFLGADPDHFLRNGMGLVARTPKSIGPCPTFL
ncbi:hypothetical protein M378DRAFT_166503 [Amanita muscaria Koide BX008]|uniref:Uncharacterized protein n=1 Tax=Amanita muscaria (strain Koide BX008) TaxID=946122 RepID=A0A0C2WY19_AMAMK|nr:hypothetical protein M378DRAFT_166503 [Amanita muscaria Koide BX008]